MTRLTIPVEITEIVPHEVFKYVKGSGADAAFEKVHDGWRVFFRPNGGLTYSLALGEKPDLKVGSAKLILENS